jgi:hypothetical protein
VDRKQTTAVTTGMVLAIALKFSMMPNSHDLRAQVQVNHRHRVGIDICIGTMRR